MAWTEKRINLLREYWGQGLPPDEIAEKLGEGVTRNAVIGKSHRLGLKQRHEPSSDERQVLSWTEERLELLRKYWDEGHSASEIARLLGGNITRNSVIAKAHRLGLKSRPGPMLFGSDKLDDLKIFAQEGLEHLSKIEVDILVRGSNRPVYPKKVMKALEGLKEAFSTLVVELNDFEEKSVRAHDIKNVGALFSDGIKETMVLGLDRLKGEVGYYSLVGTIGYIITLTGNPEIAAVVVGILLGKDGEKK